MMTQGNALAETIGRHALQDGTFETRVPGLKLIRCSQPTLPMPVIYEPTLCLVAQGSKRVMLGQAGFTYDKTSYLVASVDLPVMGSVIEARPERPYLSLQLDLDTVELADLAIRHPARTHQPTRTPSGLLIDRADDGVVDAARRLLGLLDTPMDIEALAPLAKREILYRLLTGSGGSLVRQIAHAGNHLNQIARAIVWIRKHFRETCPVEAAAEVAGMSRSTFHAHFKAVTNMSPLEFRTQLRLQEARRLMLSDGLDAGTAGFEVGYASPSQFSREYAKVFGMPPARHATILRSAADSSDTFASAP